jgi:hypothetical protein
MKSTIASWWKHINRQGSILPLAFIRILVGSLAFLDFIGYYFVYYKYKQSLVPGEFHFKYYGFEWVIIPPEPYWTILFIVGWLSAVGVILGYRYKWSMTLLFLVFSFVFLSEKALYLNHGYLFCVLLFWLIFFPAHRFLSLDVYQKRVERADLVPKLYQNFLCFLMGMVYFYGGLAKINPDWLQAVPMLQWLEAKGEYWLIGPLLQMDGTAWFMSYAGLLFDLLAPLGLLYRPTRNFFFFWALGFHIINTAVFQIGIFPWLSIGLTALFFSDQNFYSIYHWIKGKIKALPMLQEHSLVPNTHHLFRSLLIPFIALMLVLPFRHHLFPGNVGWTEEGHRCSWRMMLRSKTGYGHFLIKKDDLVLEKVRPRDYLSPRQERKLYTHPDMILEFAHFLSKIYDEKLEEPVAVHANIYCKLNTGDYQKYIDESINLAEIKWSAFRHSDWIIPQEVK